MLPSAMNVKASGYAPTKICQTKLLEIFAAENPDIFVGIFHPGVGVQP